MKKIKLEKCPYCGGEPVICSHGGVNCPDCFQHIRMLTPEEKKIHRNNMKETLKKIKSGEIEETIIEELKI